MSAGSKTGGVVSCWIGVGAGVGDDPGTTGTKSESGEGVMPGVPAGAGIVPGGSFVRGESLSSNAEKPVSVWEYPIGTIANTAIANPAVEVYFFKLR